MKLPVFSSSDGRTVIGYAEGIRSATLVIRRTITIDPAATLYVWKRTDIMQDCLDLPEGYCYSLAYGRQ
jgi:hypothetical protein